MKTVSKVWIVDDDRSIRWVLEKALEQEGIVTSSFDSGDAALKALEKERPDTLISDIRMPGMDGFEICNAIRAKDRNQPIIMLTAKTSDEEIIQGLKLGADDYVAKPFSIQQLVLRIEAVLRRSRIGIEQARTISLSNNVQIDTENLTGQNGAETLTFTRREIEILRYLAANSTRPVPRDELLTKVWGYARNLEIETRTVDIHIAKLRRKIETNPKEPAGLITVRGAGYRLLTAD